MESTPSAPRTTTGSFLMVVLVNITLAIQVSSIAFVNSSFLAQFFVPETVSLIYTVSAAVGLGLLFLIPRILQKFGAWKTLLLALPLLQLLVLIFGITSVGIIAALFFVLRSSVQGAVIYLMDLFFEATVSDQSKTGNLRGVFLNGGTVGWIVGPALASVVIIGTQYAPLYALAALILMPAFFIVLAVFKNIPIRPPNPDMFKETFSELRTCRISVRYTMYVQFVYQLLSVWIIIYVPLYLSEAGYSWQTIGSLIALGFLPYLFLEIPLGIVADKILGEKEFMITGIVLGSITTVLLSVVSITSLFLWGAVFILARVAHVLLEIGTETYFFKSVTEAETSLISMFRMLLPLAGIVAPLVALAVIPFTGLQYLFGVLGVAVLIALPFTFKIRDTL